MDYNKYGLSTMKTENVIVKWFWKTGGGGKGFLHSGNKIYKITGNGKEN